MPFCSLCSLKLPKKPVWHETKPFCCSGCLTVFKILAAQEVKPPFSDHPLLKRALEIGLISNPLLQEKEEVVYRQQKKITFQIDDLFCPACAEAITLLLEKEKGIIEVFVDYPTDLAVVKYAPEIVGKETIFEKIKKLGYLPKSLIDTEEKSQGNASLIIAAFCAINMMMLSIPLYIETLGTMTEGYEKVLGGLLLFLSLPLVLYSGRPIWKRFWVQLKAKMLGMEALVFLGTFASFTFSTLMLVQGKVSHLYFDSMGMLLFLVLFGRFLEKKAKIAAKERLFSVTRTLPNKARLLKEDESSRFVPVQEVEVGDRIKVLTGEKIPLDGEVVRGEGACDESVMTGESLPLWKQKTDSVVGGSLLKRGELVIQALQTAKESTLSKMQALVENQLGQKKKQSSLVDNIASFFVPCVFILALVTFTALFAQTGNMDLAFTRGLTICLISCPCVIGLASPMAEAFLIAELAKRKIIVRNRRALSVLGKETLLIFDKTGTLTKGQFLIQAGLEALTPEEKSILKTLSHHSRHPLCLSLSFVLSGPLASLEKIQEIPGKGMQALFQGEPVYLGSQSFFQEREISYSAAPSFEEVGTTLYFSIGAKVLPPLVLRDTLRAEVPRTLKTLEPTKLMLLSGDTNESVAKVAQSCGFQRWHAEVSPLEKGEVVQKWQAKGEIVGVIGDGINDAPALAAADIGISTSGALDLTMHSSDLILRADDLSLIPKIRSLGRRTRGIIKQNLFWAFGYNVLGLILALRGSLTPLFAIFAMASSSLVVLLNTLRLKTRDFKDDL